MQPSRFRMCTSTWRRRASSTRFAAHAARRAPPAVCPTLLCELPLSGAELEPVAPGGREGRVASRRAVPARRLHRDEPASPGQEGRRLLQRPRHGGAVHQGGQARGQVDAAVVHALPGQRGAPPTPRAAYNLANFLRTLALPGEVERWSLTSLREKVVKIGAKVIAHGRYAIFQMAEVAVPRELFGRILERIARLRPPDPAPC